jgi:hypothetical protein
MMGQDEPGSLPAVRALESELLEIEACGCRSRAEISRAELPDASKVQHCTQMLGPRTLCSSPTLPRAGAPAPGFDSSE